MATAKLLETNLANCNIYAVAELAEADIPSSTIIVSLLEMNATFIDGISATDYNDLQKILLRYKHTIWVTKTASGEMEPQHHLVDGLGRVLASEDSTRKFITLTLDVLDQDPEQTMDLITNLINRVGRLPVEELETNFVASRSGLEVCRISENSHMNMQVANAISPRQNAEFQVTADSSLSLRIEYPGQLNTLGWISGETFLADLSVGDDEVLIEARAFGLTFRDFLVASGHLNELGLGTECAGVVLAAGKASGFQQGGRVCALGSSMAQSTVRAKAAAIYPIKSDMSFSEAASIPTSIWLSYHALVDLARLQEGDTILIYQATSSFGQMAFQLARKLGANVIITTSSVSKGEYLTNKLNIPKASILLPEDASLPGKVYHFTEGRGVDIIVGPLLSNNVVDFSECLSPFGRLIDISLASEVKSMKIPSTATNMNMNMSLASVNMASLLELKPKMAYTTFQNAMKAFLELGLKPAQPLCIFQADQVGETFHRFHDRGLTEKRVVELHPGNTILVCIIRVLCFILPQILTRPRRASRPNQNTIYLLMPRMLLPEDSVVLEEASHDGWLAVELVTSYYCLALVLQVLQPKILLVNSRSRGFSSLRLKLTLAMQRDSINY